MGKDLKNKNQAIEAAGFKEGESFSSEKVREVEVTETSGKMRYASLHHHTTYSFLDGFGLPEDHAEIAAKRGYKALAVTEHGNVSSHPKHQTACKERGIHPIFGCELYMSPTGVVEPTAKNPFGMSRRKNHLTVLAKDSAGYRSLMRMVSRGWAEGMFDGTMTVFEDNLIDNEEGIIVLSGCTASLLATSLVGGKNVEEDQASYKRAKRVASKYKEVFGDRFYLEVQQMPELESVSAINVGYQRLGRELGIPLAATADVHVPAPEDQSMRVALHAIGRGGRSVDELGQEWDYTVDGFVPRSDKSVYNRLLKTGLDREAAKEAILSTEEIAERCDVELPFMPMVRFPVPGGKTAKQYWVKLLKEGWKRRGIDRLPKSEQKRYSEQLKHEMGIIEQKDYIDYFLIVADLTIYAKENGIFVGPGRGSAAASLVCYLMRITEVDPLKFPNLIFSRFIDITREDLPDIDLDFDDERRYLVFEYAEQKYGRDYTGKIGTITKYRSKNSMDDIARVYQIPKWEVDTVKDLMIERSSGDFRASSTVEDTVEAFDQAREVFEKYPDLKQAMKLEGNIKGLGVHAAGLVISSQPITDVCAVYSKSKDEGTVEVVSLDKYSGEDLGLLKIDILGLKEMGILRECCEEVGMSIDDLYNIPLDDPLTTDGFKKNDIVGVFQFDGWSTQLVSDQVRPDNFLEACDIIAIARPGPLHNGASTEYIDVKKGNKSPRKYHPLLDDITAYTAYQIVYQEQILKICMEIGNFDYTHQAYIRRIISRKIGEQEFARQTDRFVEGALSNGLTREDAEEIWGACITAGSYAFNFAHTVSYGMVAWWTMWFKQHYPEVFFAAALKKRSGDAERRTYLLRDAVKHGIRILPPDPNKSSESWRVSKKGKRPIIRAGFSQIPGIGDKSAPVILETRREMKGFKSWSDLIKVKGVGPKKLEQMLAFVNQDDPFDIFTLEKMVEEIKNAIGKGELPLPMPTHHSTDIPYSRNKEEDDIQVVWTGRILDRNVRDIFEVNVARSGIPLDPSEVKDPDKNEWIIMKCEDHTGKVSLKIDRWRYPKFREAIWAINPDKDFILVKGIKKGYETARRIQVKQLWVLEGD